MAKIQGLVSDFYICSYLSSDMGEHCLRGNVFLWQKKGLSVVSKERCIICVKRSWCKREKTNNEKSGFRGHCVSSNNVEVKVRERKWEGFRQKEFPRNPPSISSISNLSLIQKFLQEAIRFYNLYMSSISYLSPIPGLVWELEGGGGIADLWDLEKCDLLKNMSFIHPNENLCFARWTQSNRKLQNMDFAWLVKREKRL